MVRTTFLFPLSILHSLFSHFLARLGTDAIRWEPWNCGAQWSPVQSLSRSRTHTNAFHVGRLANCHGIFWFHVNLSSLIIIILCLPSPFANDDMPPGRKWSPPPQASIKFFLTGLSWLTCEMEQTMHRKQLKPASPTPFSYSSSSSSSFYPSSLSSTSYSESKFSIPTLPLLPLYTHILE